MTDVRSLAARTLRAAGVEHERLSFIELNRSSDAEAAFALLVFLDGASRPFALLKATPDEARAEHLEREFRNLRWLEHAGGATLDGTHPRALALERFERMVVLAETALPGRRLKDLDPDRYFASKRFADDLDRIVDWLVALHAAAAADPPWTPDADTPDVRREIDRFVDGFEVSDKARALLSRCREELADYRGPLVPSHGDFCTANVLVADGARPAVIDWEYPLSPSWPLADLLYFLASAWAVPYAKGPRAVASNFRRWFVESGARGGVGERAIRRYAAAVGLPDERLEAVSVASWIAYANRKRDELRPTDDPQAHLPLIMFEGRRFLNLELLAG